MYLVFSAAMTEALGGPSGDQLSRVASQR